MWPSKEQAIPSILEPTHPCPTINTKLGVNKGPTIERSRNETREGKLFHNK